jgi:hypothetical protein
MLVERNRRGQPHLGHARSDASMTGISESPAGGPRASRLTEPPLTPNEELTMSTTNFDRTTTPRAARVAHDETRPARRTTELMAYLATVLAVVVTAFVVGDDDNGVDAFGAAQALQYVTFLTIGYMLARGLAKSGSHSRSSEND